jgi:hypothetical protein
MIQLEPGDAVHLTNSIFRLGIIKTRINDAFYRVEEQYPIAKYHPRTIIVPRTNILTGDG